MGASGNRAEGGRAEGKRALVTGAASGIGLAAARRLLAEGASVIAVDISADRLGPLRDEGMEILAADLGDLEQRQRVIEAGAGIDHLVNAAGIIRFHPIFENTVADFQAMYRVNVEAPWFLCQGIGPTMPAGGSIVNLSSSSAKLSTTTELAVYASTKAAILSLTRSFAYALAKQQVRVNAICPGIIDTPMQDYVLATVGPARGMTPEELSRTRNAGVPLGRSGSPEECAGLIWFLLSGDSAYMTGQAINLTGGLVMW
jgi:NAD(P)-dependent dehydrogenase (short-subunit alcohol dehydrogenase family)